MRLFPFQNPEVSASSCNMLVSYKPSDILESSSLISTPLRYDSLTLPLLFMARSCLNPWEFDRKIAKGLSEGACIESLWTKMCVWRAFCMYALTGGPLHGAVVVLPATYNRFFITRTSCTRFIVLCSCLAFDACVFLVFSPGMVVISSLFWRH